MDYCTVTGKVKLTTAEHRSLAEAAQRLRHAARISGSLTEGVGLQAATIAAGIDKVLEMVLLPKPKDAKPQDDVPKEAASAHSETKDAKPTKSLIA